MHATLSVVEERAVPHKGLRRPMRLHAPHLSAYLARRERRMRALRMALESLLGLFQQVAGADHADHRTLRQVRRALAEARREATGARD